MPCIFCLAVFALIAGAMTAASIDEAENNLAQDASDAVERTVDTDSVVKFETTYTIGDKSTAVTVTIYKEHRRARIQIMSHELTPGEVKELEDRIAKSLGAKIVGRSNEVGNDEVEAEHEHIHAEHEHEHENVPSDEQPAKKQENPPPPPSPSGK